jgi:hypothetical protein
VAQHRAPLPVSLDQEAIYHGEKFSMTAPATWPTRNHEAAQPDDDDSGGQSAPAQALPGHEHAHEVITEMADLLRDNRGGLLTGGCLLGAVAAGLALEAGVAARELRPGLIGVINLGLLCGIVCCWLVAAFLLARAGRPVLNAVSQLRWVTGAPLDPRPAWVTLPPVGADPAEWTWNRAYLLLGATRLSRYRMQLADTWTYFAGGCFLAWTMLVILGR